MKVPTQLFLLCTLCTCIFSAGGNDAPAFTVTPSGTVVTVEGHNVTLEWKYNFGSTGSFRQLLFSRNFVGILVDKSPSDIVPYVTPAYKDRLLVNVTHTYASITFLEVKRTDSTRYTLNIISSSRKSVDNLVDISVQYQPEITAHPRSEEKTEGESVTLSCDAQGFPAPTILWTRNGSPIDPSGNSTISFSADKKQLTIMNVSRTDSGEYRCVANNSLGNDTSNPAILDMQYQPVITAHPLSDTKTEGENVALSCNATGNPVPTMSWTRNGSPIDTSGNSRITYSADKKQLTITNVNRTDSGEYRCVATNSLGNDTSNAATLDVQLAPNPPFNVKVDSKSSRVMNISWTAGFDGNTPIMAYRVNISKDNQNFIDVMCQGSLSDRACVLSNSFASASLENLSPWTTYYIKVVAVYINGTIAGSSVVNATTNEEVAPNPPFNVKIDAKSSRVMNISWTAGFDGNTPILAYTVKISEDNQNFRDVECQGSVSDSACVLSNSFTSASLESLSPWTTYYIRVFTRNKIGPSTGSSVVNATTDEEEPSKAPSLTVVKTLNSTSIQVEWEYPVPPQNRHGYISKYVILYTDEIEKGEMNVPAPALKAIVNGLKQSTTYIIQVLAATVKGNGPPSDPKSSTTEDPPTPSPPSDDDIGTTEVSINFVNKQTLSNGKSVRFYQIIVIPLTDGQNPGKSSDGKYVKITRAYEDKMEGQPYVTAEFANEKSQRAKFPVGDGKYYSRSYEARRKRRDTSLFNKYLNGKLDDNTKYAVFQRSFHKNGDYENEGFSKFTTMKMAIDDEFPTIVVLSVVVGLLLLIIVVGAIIMWRRFHHNETKTSSRTSQHCSTQEIIEMSASVNLATSQSAYCNTSTDPSYYYNTNLPDRKPATEGQTTYEAVDDQVANYDNVDPKQEDIYQEIDQRTHYQPLNLNREVNYEGFVKPTTDSAS